MKWNSQDVDIFLKSKEYVDTAVLPLFPVTFNHDIKQAALMTEFINLLSVPLEKQFKGRILLFPGFSYLQSSETDKLLADLKLWENQLIENGFKYVFYLTSDTIWNQFQEKLSGSVIWLPSIPLETMDETAKMAVLESQVKQMINLFTQKWRG